MISTCQMSVQCGVRERPSHNSCWHQPAHHDLYATLRKTLHKQKRLDNLQCPVNPHQGQKTWNQPAQTPQPAACKSPPSLCSQSLHRPSANKIATRESGRISQRVTRKYPGRSCHAPKWLTAQQICRCRGASDGRNATTVLVWTGQAFSPTKLVAGCAEETQLHTVNQRNESHSSHEKATVSNLPAKLNQNHTTVTIFDNWQSGSLVPARDPETKPSEFSASAHLFNG